MKTPEELVQDFINGVLYIGIKGASTEDMRALQNILHKKWRTGDDLDYDRHMYLTISGYDYHLHNNTHMSGEATLSVTSDPPEDAKISFTEFLSLFDLNIEESEVEKMFEG